MPLKKDEEGRLLIDFVKLAQQSEGMSGAEICLITREAGLKALTEDSNIEKASLDELFVTEAHLERALMEVKARGKQTHEKPSLFH